ncbi:MAG: hypothetical protein IKH77_04740 [Clostridia bacterium]|nr:hypothetical protein [Oscillospiraceae bacterium]MBR6954326.1 hypothetical protein [Clostridia bacterium]
MNERNTNSQRPAARSRRAPQGGAALLSRAPILTLVLLFGLFFLLMMAVKGCASQGDSEGSQVPDPAQTQQSTLQTDSLPAGETQSTEAPVISSEPVTTEPVTSVPTTTPVPTTTEPPGPTMMTVDDRYFDDALFLGDSRTDGLFLYSTPGDCKHYPFPATSLTIFKCMDAEDEEHRYGYSSTRELLKGEKFGKIYLMFGINECGYDTAVFADKYREVVEEIRSLQPDALIYIQSICYVTQNHEAKYPVFASSNIKEKNEAIKQLANDVDIFYLEVNDALNDGTDHLPSDYTGDGAHLKANCYRYWHDYLLQHAYVDAQHPWAPEAGGTETTAPETGGTETAAP